MKDKLKQAVKTYNKIANIYSEYTANILMQYQLSKFSSLLPGKRILDAGCGSGRDAQYFVEDGFNVTAIDFSEEMIKLAKKKTKKAKFKVMDFRKMNFKDESFDGVWSMASLVHTDRIQIPKVLKEFSRVLVSGGILYVSVKEGEGDKEIKQIKYENEPRHFFYFKKDEFDKYLIDKSFSILTSEVSELETGKRWLEIFAKKN